MSRALDSHEADVDEPFDSILGPIDYPGDPGMAPENVWNRRCSLGYNYSEHPSGVDPDEWPELESYGADDEEAADDSGNRWQSAERGGSACDIVFFIRWWYLQCSHSGCI